MNHAELSRDLALAIGYYPESVQINEGDCGVYRISNSIGPYWRTFDYREPRVWGPVLEWLMREHRFPAYWFRIAGKFVIPGADNRIECDTLPEAVARAAIAIAQAKRQEVEAHENREALQP